MKKLLFPLFMLAMIVTSCEKDPDMNKLDSDYSVYTDYDNSVHFNEFSTYYLPDSILVPDNSLKANYWKDENAQNIIISNVAGQEVVRAEFKDQLNVSKLSKGIYFLRINDSKGQSYHLKFIKK